MKRKKAVIVCIALVFIGAIVAGAFLLNRQDPMFGVDVLELSGGGKHLLFYGSAHSNNEKHPMFTDIEKRFDNASPQLVLVEGYMDRNVYNTRNEAIASGESAFAVFLAQQKGLQTGCVEPTKKEQYEYLLKKYDRNDILLMYVFRQMFQYQREHANNPIDIGVSLRRYVKDMAGDGFPLSEEETRPEFIFSLATGFLNMEIDTGNWTKADFHSPVYKQGSVLHEIYTEVLNMRNEHLLMVIKDSLQRVDRVFVIMGSDHLETEGESIKAIFTSASSEK